MILVNKFKVVVRVSTQDFRNFVGFLNNFVRVEILNIFRVVCLLIFDFLIFFDFRVIQGLSVFIILSFFDFYFLGSFFLARYFSLSLVSCFDLIFGFLLLLIKNNKNNVIKFFIRVQGTHFKVLFLVSSHKFCNLFCLVLNSPSILLVWVKVDFIFLLCGKILFSLFFFEWLLS